MNLQALQIGWICAALFFGIGQALLGILVSFSPLETDKAIEYFEWAMRPLDYILKMSIASLLFAVVLTWAFSAHENTAVWYVISFIITVFAFTSYLLWKNLLYRIIQTRIR